MFTQNPNTIVTLETYKGWFFVITTSVLLFAFLIRLFNQIIKQNDELKTAKEKAEKFNYLKTEFLAQMSHEIRTPINAILSSANLIKQETENELKSELKEFFPIINSAGNRIIRTIDSILNMSELQLGTYEPSFKEFSLNKSVLENLFQEFKPIAERKGLKIIKVIESVDDILKADLYSIEQLFSNLIHNAIKYTDKGFIEIKTYRNGKDKLCVDVKDTGVGISDEFIDEIFHTFRQEHQGYSRKFEGNGLGLALVKKYCEINNAEVSVKSKKNVGSTFTVEFSLQ